MAKKPIALIIMDGYGINQNTEGNAIVAAKKPHLCLATVENQYLDGRAGLICGEDTAGQIDKEVLSIINNSYNEAMQMLTENREILDHISEYLYEKETITGKEFMKIFREMKGLPQEEDKEALMPDDAEKDKKDSKAAFVSDDMFED